MAAAPRIAVVEDDRMLLDVLLAAFLTHGFDPCGFSDGESFWAAIEGGETPEVAVLDVVLPGMSGLEVLEKLHHDIPSCRAIVLTAHRQLDYAVEALREGAVEYLLKPVTAEEVVATVARVVRTRRRRSERVAEPAAPAGLLNGLAAMMGPSQEVARLQTFAEKAAASEVPVLISGETGTGKELVAQAIHRGSRRAHSPLVAVNCGAIPDNLVESELFGNVRGAFTGADRDRSGLIAAADGSTLFLDEIGELPLPSQVKLLRVLQEGRVRPLGGGHDRSVDLRVVAATNLDLEGEVAAGRFRRDLFYRLGVLRLRLPPLRERTQDIPHLVGRFLQRYAPDRGQRAPDISHRALRALQRYAWPGNVRELENEIARAITLGEGGQIRLNDLSEEIRAWGHLRSAGSLRAALEQKERNLIVGSLEQTGWNKTDAARLLGMSRQNLYQRMAHHGIPRRPALNGTADVKDS